MAKGVFTCKVEPAYDDLPEQRYHFPKTYLEQARLVVGDWILYYEPRRTTTEPGSGGGRQAYFATARVVRITPDPRLDGHFYAWVADYLEFDEPVPFRKDGFYYEASLRKEDGSTNKGAFGRAIRTLADLEYARIVQVGFGHLLGERQRESSLPNVPEEPTLLVDVPPQQPFDLENVQVERPLITQILQRPFRDRAFAAAVKTAYNDTCAITGFKIINGSGRSEVQAAHIRPVAHNGPDSVRNGIALSGTIHWLFDSGLISIAEDKTLLVVGSSLPGPVLALLKTPRSLNLPQRPEDRPHEQFLRYHRNIIFKGQC